MAVTGLTVSSRTYPSADQSKATLILAHGAGAGQLHPFMVGYANALAALGVDVVTFNFPYMDAKRRVPDAAAVLENCYRTVIGAVRRDVASAGRALFIGGKSMGGRIASQVAAGGISDLAGLVFLGYPLHPPGRPDRLRAAHLSDVKAPMLFVQGSRDAFGTPNELRPIAAPLHPPAEIYVVENGDHSFKVPRRSGVPQGDVHRAIQDHVAAWLRGRK
jgi:predicted alpha/beta-hydrolase family hydrolase